MGFLGLVPFTNAGAVYDPAQQVLTVSAEGEAPKFTSGYFFKRVPWAGGLRFELYGWTGPLSPGTEPFQVSQPFNIPNLLLNDPGNTIIVVGSNHTTGETYEIKWLGLKPPATNGQPLKTENSVSTATPQAPQTLDAETPATINSLYKEPFTISERAFPGLGATLNMDFDRQFLMLTSAGIDRGDLVWTFNSLETGVTQVVTYSTEGLGTPVIRKVYTVKVFVLDSAAPQSSSSSSSSQGNGVALVSNLAASNGQNGKNGAATQPGAILSFLGRVSEAQRIAQGALPSARLLRVQATLPAGPFYPVTDPLRLSQLDVLSVGDGGEYVTVRSTGWGEWAPPVVRKGTPVVGLQTFAVEDCKVDVAQAGEAVRADVGTKAFFEVTLSRPFGAPQDGPYNPLYTFQMVDTSLISVDAVTGKIIGA